MTTLKRKRTGTTFEKRRKKAERIYSGNSNIINEESGNSSRNNALNAQEVLRRHFESQFGSIEEILGEGQKNNSSDNSSDDEDGDNWDSVDSSSVFNANSSDDDFNDNGDYEDFSDISEEDARAANDDGPIVVDYSTTSSLTSMTFPKPSKAEIKAFMSHKPPSIIPTTDPALAPKLNNPRKPPKIGSKSSEGDDSPGDEATNLKNDLALQRLLRESHLLSGDPLNSSLPLSLQPTGKNRLRAIESRIQALGGKDLTKHRMPLPMKRGIEKARLKREEKRVKMARDAGIVLEKNLAGEVEKRKKKAEEEKRRRKDRGFGPAVGKFRNGALVLSKKDIREIEGPKTDGISRGKKEKGKKG